MPQNINIGLNIPAGAQQQLKALSDQLESIANKAGKVQGAIFSTTQERARLAALGIETDRAGNMHTPRDQGYQFMGRLQSPAQQIAQRTAPARNAIRQIGQAAGVMTAGAMVGGSIWGGQQAMQIGSDFERLTRGATGAQGAVAGIQKQMIDLATATGNSADAAQKYYDILAKTGSLSRNPAANLADTRMQMSVNQSGLVSNQTSLNYSMQRAMQMGPQRGVDSLSYGIAATSAFQGGNAGRTDEILQALMQIVKHTEDTAGAVGQYDTRMAGLQGLVASIGQDNPNTPGLHGAGAASVISGIGNNLSGGNPMASAMLFKGLTAQNGGTPPTFIQMAQAQQASSDPKNISAMIQGMLGGRDANKMSDDQLKQLGYMTLGTSVPIDLMPGAFRGIADAGNDPARQKAIQDHLGKFASIDPNAMPTYSAALAQTYAPTANYDAAGQLKDYLTGTGMSGGSADQKIKSLSKNGPITAETVMSQIEGGGAGKPVQGNMQRDQQAITAATNQFIENGAKIAGTMADIARASTTLEKGLGGLESVLGAGGGLGGQIVATGLLGMGAIGALGSIASFFHVAGGIMSAVAGSAGTAGAASATAATAGTAAATAGTGGALAAVGGVAGLAGIVLPVVAIAAAAYAVDKALPNAPGPGGDYLPNKINNAIIGNWSVKGALQGQKTNGGAAGNFLDWLTTPIGEKPGQKHKLPFGIGGFGGEGSANEVSSTGGAPDPFGAGILAAGGVYLSQNRAEGSLPAGEAGGEVKPLMDNVAQVMGDWKPRPRGFQDTFGPIEGEGALGKTIGDINRFAPIGALALGAWAPSENATWSDLGQGIQHPLDWQKGWKPSTLGHAFVPGWDQTDKATWGDIGQGLRHPDDWRKGAKPGDIGTALIPGWKESENATWSDVGIGIKHPIDWVTGWSNPFGSKKKTEASGETPKGSLESGLATGDKTVMSQKLNVGELTVSSTNLDKTFKSGGLSFGLTQQTIDLLSKKMADELNKAKGQGGFGAPGSPSSGSSGSSGAPSSGRSVIPGSTNGTQSQNAQAVANWVQQYGQKQGWSQNDISDMIKAETGVGFAESGLQDVTNGIGATGPFQMLGDLIPTANRMGGVHTVEGGLNAVASYGRVDAAQGKVAAYLRAHPGDYVGAAQIVENTQEIPGPAAAAAAVADGRYAQGVAMAVPPTATANVPDATLPKNAGGDVAASSLPSVDPGNLSDNSAQRMARNWNVRVGGVVTINHPGGSTQAVLQQDNQYRDATTQPVSGTT